MLVGSYDDRCCEVELFLHQNEANRSVERIQDEVERSLMEHGFYAEAKNYIPVSYTHLETVCHPGILC